MSFRVTLLSALFFLCTTLAFSQEEGGGESSLNSDDGDKSLGAAFNKMSASLSAGVNIYHGDLASYDVFPGFSQFGTHASPGFKFSLARELKWALGLRANFQQGGLSGTRKTGKYSSIVNFENNFFDASLQLRYRLSKLLFNKENEYNRFVVHISAGYGAMWYRTKLYDPITLNTKDFEGYVEVDEFKNSSQKTLSAKTEKAQTWTIPYGVMISYRWNYKMDLHLEVSQSATTTDRLDAFGRDWTANDKYNYIGLGLTYNFNRTPADEPKKRPKDEDEDDEDDEEDDEDDDKGFLGLFGKKKGKGGDGDKKESGDDPLLNVRLKLFETQLKLFEMQYLLGK